MELNLNLKVPAGSAVTICHNNNGSNIGGTNHTPNTHTAPQPQPQAHASRLRELGKLNREQLRKALTNARLNAAALINLSSALHGSLYPLVAIGGKVAKR
jgi:hypothetical protein